MTAATFHWQELDNLPPVGELTPRLGWGSWTENMHRWSQEKRRREELADLRRVVRDQAAYIRSLEEQLAPMLVRPLAEQEAML